MPPFEGVGGRYSPPKESAAGRGRGRGAPPKESQNQARQVNNLLKQLGASSITDRRSGLTPPTEAKSSSTTVQPVNASGPSATTVQPVHRRTNSNANSTSSNAVRLTPAQVQAMLASASNQSPNIDLSGPGRTVQPIPSSSSSSAGGTVAPVSKTGSHIPPKESSRK